MSRPPLQHWPTLSSLSARRLSGGLINETFAVGDPPQAVLQRLHPVFPGRVCVDIDAVTHHLDAQLFVTPKLIPTVDGALWEDSDQGPWRALSWVPGETVEQVQGPAQAAQAGALVARWHKALAGLKHDFVFSRPLAHHTPHHMEMLERAVAEHPGHRLAAKVRPLADAVLQAWGQWAGDLDEPTQFAHGDLKISNLRFTAAGEGLCLLDLDTMGQLPLSVELGDAWRSWCNTATEDAPQARFDLSLFHASAQGYLSERALPAWQRELLPLGVQRICLELSARFLADALNESYFGWDRNKAPTRGAHNLIRGAGQLSLAQSVQSQLPKMAAALRG